MSSLLQLANTALSIASMDAGVSISAMGDTAKMIDGASFFINYQREAHRELRGLLAGVLRRRPAVAQNLVQQRRDLLPFRRIT